MCIKTQSLGTALLPKFAFDAGYDVTLLQLISAYQKDPGTETYNSVQKFLVEKKKENQSIMNTFNNDKTTFTTIDIHIIDYESNLLWSTSPLKVQGKIVLLYEASEYSSQATQGSAYKKFEDGSEYALSLVSGAPLFIKGGALRIGVTSIDLQA
jgi:alpha-mannosidase